MRIGFISALAETRQASACKACARPISRPSGVAAEFSDMFWALKGATRLPSSAKMRPIAAVNSDLPTCDAVPRIISARAPIRALPFPLQFGPPAPAAPGAGGRFAFGVRSAHAGSGLAQL